MSIAVFLGNYGTGRRQFINDKSDISLPLVSVLKKTWIFAHAKRAFVCLYA